MSRQDAGRSGDRIAAENLGMPEPSVPWRPSPLAPRVYVKDLGAADGYVMQLVRYEAGGVAPIEGAAGAAFLYVLQGELIYAGRRLWPGAAAVLPPSGRVRAHSDSGCTFLSVHLAEPPESGGPPPSPRA